MKQGIEKLISVLQQSQALYEQMLPLMADEKKATLEGDVGRIHRQAIEKEVLVSRLKDLEKERELLLTELAGQFGCPRARLTMRYLVGQVEPRCAARLEGLHNSLRALLRTVRKLNEENQACMTHILKVVKNGLHFFDRTCDGLPVYGASGSIDGHQASHGLILSNTV